MPSRIHHLTFELRQQERGHILAGTPSFEKKGKVSIWLGVRKPDVKAMDVVDILRDLCGAEYYDVDEQEGAAAGDTFPKAAILRRSSDQPTRRLQRKG